MSEMFNMNTNGVSVFNNVCRNRHTNVSTHSDEYEQIVNIYNLQYFTPKIPKDGEM